MKLVISDWVKVKNRSNYIGFVINIYDDPDEKEVSIRLSQPPYLANKCLTMKAKELEIWQAALTEEDIKELIDLSLLLNDEDWFHELSQQQHNNQRL